MARQIVLASPLEGRMITQDGAPAAGVTIERQWTWRGKTGGDRTQTDADGRFSFDVATRRPGLLGLLPQQENVSQVYTANGEMFLRIGKTNYDLHGELRGRPMKIECTLGAPLASGVFFHSNCREVKD